MAWPASNPSEVIMANLELQSERLVFRLQSPTDVLSWVATLAPEVRSEISPLWLERIRNLSEPDPWYCMFDIWLRDREQIVGQCGFKGPPDEDHAVEIAYGIEPEFQNRGIATEAVFALIDYAYSQENVVTILAHTREDGHASQRVLQKAGLRFVGLHEDPEDGIVHRWRRDRRS
jgi:RimJ/RimL family protein N-acetyltransferase